MSDNWSAAKDIDIKKCPFCAEDIKLEAIKCKHCKSDLTQGENAREVNLKADNDLNTPAVGSEAPKQRTKAPRMLVQSWYAVQVVALIATGMSRFNYQLAQWASLLNFSLFIGSAVLLFFVKGFRLHGCIGAIAAISMMSIVGPNVERLEPADVKQARWREEKIRLAERADEMHRKAEKKAGEPPLTGETGYVGPSTIMAAEDAGTYSEMLKAVDNDDKLGLVLMARRGQIINLERGTSVKVIGSIGFLGNTRKIRILAGERIGEVWYVASEHLVRKLLE